MPVPTSIPAVPSLLQESNTEYWWQTEARKLQPIKRNAGTARPSDPDNLSDIAPTSAQGLPRAFESPVPILYPHAVADSIPLQIWEGTVLKVDSTARAMHVLLNAKMGVVPRHTAEIDLEWVSDQDEDLVRPGAVFYLTLFKRTKRGSIENSQELRFRRRPSWSQSQLERITDAASKIVEKMEALPVAE